jgi:hypothetical protein
MEPNNRPACLTLDPDRTKAYSQAVNAADQPLTAPRLPDSFARWLSERGWTPRAHQLELLR